jgi:hypothetical protein
MVVLRTRRFAAVVMAMAAATSCSDGDREHGPEAVAESASPSSAASEDVIEPVPSTSEPEPEGALVAVVGVVHEERGALEVCEAGTECAGEIVTGVELRDLPGGADGISDRVRLTGRYDGRTLTVTEPVESAGPSAVDTIALPVPCPEPEGGWPQRFPTDPGALDAYIAAHRDEFAGRWNAPGVPVLAFTGDADAHAAAIAAVWDAAVCVTGLRFSEDHIMAAYEELVVHAQWPSGTLRGAGVDTVDNVLRIDFWRTDQATLDAIEQGWGDAVEVHAFLVVLDRPVTELPAAPPPGPDEIPIVTADQPSSVSMDALGTFTLHYDADGDCIFFTPVGADDVRVQPIWPYGTRALRDPVRIVDADGGLVLRDGDTFSVGGGEVGPPREEPICGATSTWVPGGHLPVVEG